jgi:hypothetical protein
MLTYAAFLVGLGLLINVADTAPRYDVTTHMSQSGCSDGRRARGLKCRELCNTELQIALLEATSVTN